MNTIEVIKRWESRERPLFKGRLIDETGCCCPQGDVLRCAGKSDSELRAMSQGAADKECAALLGISRGHAVLLRNVNDEDDGTPQSVLKASGLRHILGPHWRLVLAFWRHMDVMDQAAWGRVAEEADEPRAAWDAAGAAAWAAARAAAWAAAGAAAGAAAWAAAWDAAWDAAWAAAWAAAWDAAWDAAGDAAWAAARAAARAAAGAAAWAAAWELVGWSKLAAPYFLRFFFPDPAAWVAAHENDRDPGIVED